MGSERSPASRKSLERRPKRARGDRWRRGLKDLEASLQLKKLLRWRLFVALRVYWGSDCGRVTAFPDLNPKFQVRNLRIWVWAKCAAWQPSELSGRNSYRSESLSV